MLACSLGVGLFPDRQGIKRGLHSAPLSRYWLASRPTGYRARFTQRSALSVLACLQTDRVSSEVYTALRSLGVGLLSRCWLVPRPTGYQARFTQRSALSVLACLQTDRVSSEVYTALCSLGVGLLSRCWLVPRPTGYLARFTQRSALSVLALLALSVYTVRSLGVGLPPDRQGIERGLHSAPLSRCWLASRPTGYQARFTQRSALSVWC